MADKDYVVQCKVNGYHVTVGYLVEATSAKEAVEKTETYCKNMHLDYSVKKRARVASTQDVTKFEKDYPDSMLC